MEKFNQAIQQESTIMEAGQSLEAMFDEAEKNRISIESFKGSGVFPDRIIDADMAHVLKLQESYRRIADKQTPQERAIHEEAKTIEKMLPHTIREAGWLGEVDTILASVYDDYVNGVDTIIQIRKPGAGTFGMEMDLTSSRNEMMEKIKEATQRLRTRGPSVVKYYDSPTTGKVGSVQLPRIIFGDSRNIMTDFATIAAEAYSDTPNMKAREQLRTHKLRDDFINVLKYQLDYFGKISRDLGYKEYSKQHYDLLSYISGLGL